MAKTADLRLRVDPELKESAANVYGKWGLNLTDAITVFLHKSVAEGGFPFELRESRTKFNSEHPKIISKDVSTNSIVLPADWDNPEDDSYAALL